MINLQLNLFLVLILFGLVNSLQAQVDVPQAVKDRFARLYPQHTNTIWEEQNSKLIATFRDKEGLKRAFFDHNAYWIETRLTQKKNELPIGIQQFITKNYKDGEITFCGKVYNTAGVWYRVESEYPDRIILKTLNGQGNLLEEQIVSYSITNQVETGT